MMSPLAHPPEETEVRFLYGGIFLTSMAMLLLQISLTRIFSFTLWYHFAYVTISVALLGYGASGSLLAARPSLAGASPAQRLPTYALCGAGCVIFGLFVFAEVPFHPFQMMTLLLTTKHGDVPPIPPMQFVYLAIFYTTVTLPFLFAGLCIATALRARSRDVSRLYFCDLAGAGAGCLLVVFVISVFQTPGAIVVAAVLMGLAGILFACAERRSSATRIAAAVVLLALVGISLVHVLEFSPSPEKFLAAVPSGAPSIRRYSTRWSPTFRTDCFGFVNEDESRIGGYAGWGSSAAWKQDAATRSPRLRMLTHDGDAGAVIYNFDGDLSKLALFDNVVLTTPYLITRDPDVLVIGVGGGTDIVNAIAHHARHVTGVELDPETVRVVKEDQADFAGHIYDRPDVTMIVGEGRSTLRHSGARYDLIQLTGVDTLAALSTGAYVLSESYLYTTDAMREFVDHLTPNGILSIVVADFDSTHGGFPRHTLRQLSLFLETLDRMGVHDPWNHVAVIASTEDIPQVSMLLKPTAFTPEEVQRLRQFADAMRFDVWAMPGVELDTLHARYLHTPPAARADFLSRIPLVLTATSDDNPFFFNFYEWRNLGSSHGEVDVGHTLATGQIIMGFILMLSLVFSVALILMPLIVFQRQGLQTQGKLGFITFFLAIGLGFIFIEISFVQKFVLFLGYPTYSLTVVLFSLLTYSGIGSWLTGRMKRPPEQRFVPLFVALAVVSLLYLFVLPSVFDTFLGSAFAVRVIVAALVLIPLGLVMGVFFPSGILVVRRANEQFVPWAWAINGCASVVATVLAVILAMGNGFRFVSVVALCTYLVGVLGIQSTIRLLNATDASRA